MTESLRAVWRGTLQQVAEGPSGAAPVVHLRGVLVSRAPFVSGRKTYAVLELEPGAPETERVKRIDAFVRAQDVQPSYSPLGRSSVLVKVVSGTARTNEVVDAVLKPGAFGSFGYCWLATLAAAATQP